MQICKKEKGERKRERKKKKRRQKKGFQNIFTLFACGFDMYPDIYGAERVDSVTGGAH
jgi:regulator of replication initiation timing